MEQRYHQGFEKWWTLPGVKGAADAWWRLFRQWGAAPPPDPPINWWRVNRDRRSPLFFSPLNLQDTFDIHLAWCRCAPSWRYIGKPNWNLVSMQMIHYRRRGGHQIPFYWRFPVANFELIGRTEKRVSGGCGDAHGDKRHVPSFLHIFSLPLSFHPPLGQWVKAEPPMAKTFFMIIKKGSQFFYA